jgi:hypothetical protein
VVGDAVLAAVVRLRDRAGALLAGHVPYLELDSLALDFDLADPEIDPDRRDVVVVAESLDLFLVSAGRDIEDEGGRATGHLNSQFTIVLQKHDRANTSKREGGKISKN